MLEGEKKLVSLALAAGKSLFSTQTGYLHCYLEDPKAVRQDPIPLVENFLYAYALLRSRFVQSVCEARELLWKLLSFEVQGRLPTYMHEYPECRSWHASIELLPVLFYLLQEGPIVLGEELYHRTDSCLKRVLCTLYEEQELPLFAQRRVDAVQRQYCPPKEEWKLDSPSQWAEFCLCAQIAKVPLDEMLSVWNPVFHVYVGSQEQRIQEGEEPVVTLLDYFMGEAFSSFSSRAEKNTLQALRAILVQPFSNKPTIVPSKDRCLILSSPLKRQCCTVYWGDEKKTHSLSLEAKHGSWSLVQEEGTKQVWSYTFSEEVPREEESVECAFL